MIEITKNENNIIYYKCSCGSNGMCTFRPNQQKAIVIVNIQCQACFRTKQVTLAQYSDEEEKNSMLDNFQNEKLEWLPTVNEEI